MVLKILRIVSFGILALILALFPGGFWTALLISNLRVSPNVPWAAVAMGFFLWGMWRYLDGRWPPGGTSEKRHRLLRANVPPGRVFGWALLAGLLGISALAGFWIVLLQIVKVPPHALPDFSKYPWLTVAAVVLMACAVSSMAEEAAIRGYFQSFLERQLPGAAAIVVSSLAIAPGHCLTQGFLWPIVLFYFLVDTMLGTMAYLTKSILPGTVVHFIGLLMFFTLIWPQDAARPLLRDAGLDTWFWIHFAQIVICGVAALVGFRQLASIIRQESARVS
jgi:membrane protease YdiL (CAAX protease family)